MALLNFSETYGEISGFLTATESSSGDYVKLFFSKDGHIITHGKDFTPTFSNSERGLVPKSNGSAKEVLRGNGTWATIKTTDLPMASSIEENLTSTTTLLNTKLIVDYVNKSFAANDAMRYKGTIEYDSTSNAYTHHTADGTSIAGFPTTCEVGDTYRVTSAGTYAGQTCSSGDLLICIKDGTGNALNTASYWTAVEANINGTTTHKVNNTSIPTYTSSPGTSFTIFAPTTGGTENQVLLSAGNAAPKWANLSAIIAGGLTDTAKKALLTAVSVSSTGVVSVTVGGTTKASSAASGTWGISISGTAAKVGHALSASGGLSMGSNVTYDGSVARTIAMLPATASTIGGVIVDKDSTNKTISVTSDGSIYLTAANVINALGYTPESSDTVKQYTTILAASATATAAITTATGNPYFNLISTLGSTKVAEGSLRISGSGKVWVSGNGSTVSIGLNAADASNYGGIKIGYITTGKNYAVQLSDGKAYVNVPWSNTTYSLATASADGLVPMFDAVGTGSLATTSWVLAKLADGTYDWYQLPSTAFANTNTWRAIKVNGTLLLGTGTNTGTIDFKATGKTTISSSSTSGVNGIITISSTWRPITVGGTSIGDNTLNFIPSGDVYLKTDTTSDGIQDISFGLSWYNITTNKYETA